MTLRTGKLTYLTAAVGGVGLGSGQVDLLAIRVCPPIEGMAKATATSLSWVYAGSL